MPPGSDEFAPESDPDPHERRDRRLRIYRRLSELLTEKRRQVSNYLHISDDSFDRLAEGLPLRSDTWLKVFHSPGGRKLSPDLRKDLILEVLATPSASFTTLLASLAGKLAEVSPAETVVDTFNEVLLI